MRFVEIFIRWQIIQFNVALTLLKGMQVYFLSVSTPAFSTVILRPDWFFILIPSASQTAASASGKPLCSRAQSSSTVAPFLTLRVSAWRCSSETERGG